MDEPDANTMFIPLQLAELLFVTLGPLSEVLVEEGHRWTMLVKTVLSTYIRGRDDMLMAMYGESAVADIHEITIRVSEQLTEWLDQLTGVEEDFEKWTEELGDQS